MKMKFLVFFLVICLTAAFCACDKQEAVPSESVSPSESAAPSESVSSDLPASPTENVSPSEGDSPAPTGEASVTEPSPEPTDKGLFVQDPSSDPQLTFPEELQGMTLPADEFDEDFLAQFEENPITAPPIPTETDPPEGDNDPSVTEFDPDLLPEHVFEE